MIKLRNQLWAIMMLLLPARIAHAQIDKVKEDWCEAFGLRCGDGDAKGTLLDLMWTTIQAILIFSGTIAFAALVYYGAVFILSRGNEEDARRAKTGIAYAIIGLFVIGLAGFIVNAIINIGLPAS